MTDANLDHPVREDDDLLTASDIAEQYGLGRNFALNLIYGGIIPSFPVGKKRRMTTRREFRKWVEASLSTPEADCSDTKFCKDSV